MDEIKRIGQEVEAAKQHLAESNAERDFLKRQLETTETMLTEMEETLETMAKQLEQEMESMGNVDPEMERKFTTFFKRLRATLEVLSKRMTWVKQTYGDGKD